MKPSWLRLDALARRPVPRARLVPLTGAESGEIHLGTVPLTIGRGQDCGLICADPALSRKHARLSPVGGVWRLEDLASANGTTVDGQAITSQDLVSGCTITFGDKVSYRFEVEAAMTRQPSLWSGIFCPQLVPERGGKAFVLRGRLTVVGRNETSDLRLNEAQISAVHARIVRRRGVATLRDTGSANGTAVNGDVVRQQELKYGDRVAFGNVAFSYERSWRPTGWALSGLGGFAVLVALAMLVATVFLPSGEKVEPLWTREMYVSQVETSLKAVVAACDREPPAPKVAHAQFEIARRSLIAADLLRPDRQTSAELNAAVEQASLSPALQRVLRGRNIITLLADLERVVDEDRTKPRPPQAFDLGNELSMLVAEFGIDTRDTPIPEDLIAEVDRFTAHWSVKYKRSTAAAITRGLPYLDMMRQELRRNHLPEIFCYLPFIESGYQADISSPVGARGLWQFMPRTARDYGLQVDDTIDQRTDPQLSTRAACQHLELLLRIFGPNSFMCAVAAYNKGQGGLARCLDKSGDLQSSWKFWNLAQVHDGCLKKETIEYVPRFLAAVVIFRNPEQYGLGGLE